MPTKLSHGHRFGTVAILLGLLLLPAIPLLADTFEWIGGGDGTSWNDAANWNKTDGISARLFPNDATDIATLANNIATDTTVSIPAGGVAVLRVEVGDADASHTFVLAGGTIATTGASPALTILNGATCRLDADLTAANFAQLTGTGLLIVNGIMNTNRVWNIGTSSPNLTVRVNGQMNTTNDNLRIQGGSRLEIANNSFTNAPNGITITGGLGRVAAYGDDRSVNRNFVFNGPDATFAGTDGHSLTLGGTTTMNVPSGTADGRPTLIVDSELLTLSGTMVLASSSDRTFHRHPVRLANQGILQLTGTSSAALDLVVDGTGTVLLNNITGSATGSGNALVIGRRNHVAGTTVALGGTGSTDSALIVGAGGTVAPGNSIGTLTVGSTTFEAGSAYEWEFSSSGNDLLNIVGDLTIDDAFTIRLVQVGPRPAGALDLMTFSGDFSGNPAAWTIILPDPSWSYIAILPTSTSNGTLQIVGLIPEPTSALLLGLLAIGATGCRRRGKLLAGGRHPSASRGLGEE